MKIYPTPNITFKIWYKTLNIIFYNHQLSIPLHLLEYYYKRGFSPGETFYRLVS